jgi:uncharacterized protein (DUF983 family)
MVSPAPVRWHDRRLMLARAIRRRCPRCGAGGIWDSFLRMRLHCPKCGLALDRGESDYFYGAYLLNFVAAELIPVAVFVVALVATWPSPPWNLLTAVTVALAIVAPIALYPTTKAIWLAVDLMFRPGETH